MRIDRQEPLALTGMACRFPGADDPRGFWTLIKDGRCAVSEMPAERWTPDALCDAEGGEEKIHCWRGGFLKTRDLMAFDWRAHRMIPREVRQMDPQHRLLLELAWEALEDAGLPVGGLRGSRVGVFIGIQWQDYFRMIARDASRVDGYTVIGNAPQFVANRISHAFGFRGPSFTLNNGCASGLTALHTACQNLWLGECDTALVGAVELALSPDLSIGLTDMGMLSRQGLCRPLDARADGYVRGEGGGIMVLKPVSRLLPRDRSYAWVRGIATRHNGHNAWIMAPDGENQESVIREACNKAGAEPGELEYVELHSVGNLKGDAIEVQALARAVAEDERREPCQIGSVKAQIGHLGAASAIASLIKVALALHREEVPAMVAPEQPHPDIPLAEWGLAVAEGGSWPQGGTSNLAGVSAVSFGGVSAHAVLSAADLVGRPEQRDSGEGTRLLPLSARCRDALDQRAQAVIEFLRQSDRPSLDEVCFTASVGRSHHQHRLAVLGATAEELAQALEMAIEGDPDTVLDSVLAEPEISAELDALGQRSKSLGPESEIVMQIAKRCPTDGLPNSEQRILTVLARLYTLGFSVAWSEFYPDGGRITSLPTYPWQRQRLWPDGLLPWSFRAVSGSDVAADPGNGSRPLSRVGFLSRFRQAASDQRRSLLDEYVRNLVGQILEMESHDVAGDLELDSLSAHELSTRLEVELGLSVAPAELLQARKVEVLCGNLFVRLTLEGMVAADEIDSSTTDEHEEREVIRL